MGNILIKSRKILFQLRTVIFRKGINQFYREDYLIEQDKWNEHDQ